jgi:RNA polymerase sigma factor (sigma-70 family)
MAIADCEVEHVTVVSDCVVKALEQKGRMEFDGDAFPELVRHFQDMAYGYAYSIVRDPFTAHDVAQESFLAAWRKLDQLEDPLAFPGWFRGIIRRVALDELRRARPEQLSAEQSDGIVSAAATPDEETIRRESIGEVRGAIEGLAESLRASVILHYIDGYPLDEVADFLGIGLQAAKKRLQRGREHMKRDLEQRIRTTVRELRPSKDSRMLDKVNIYTNFAIAAQMGQVSLLEAMLVDGIDVNEPDVMGRTLLHWAVENGHLEMIELLLRNGADQDMRDHEGRSPRQMAEAAEAGAAMLRLMNEAR